MSGNYKCSCTSGYVLLENSYCRAPNGSNVKILFAHDKSVWSLEQQGGSQTLLANATQASGLDYHYERKLLFWSDTKTRKVQTKIFCCQFE